MSNEELAAAIKRGEREKLPQLWAQVERFVLKHAHRWALALDGAGGITADDLAQAGYLAMAEAVGRFDPEAGGAFMTVLWYALKQEFTQAAGLRTKRERKDPLRLAASLDIPATDEEDGEPLEALIAGPQAEQDFETIEAKQLHDALENALHSLTVVQLAVIRCRYYLDMTQQQTARALDMERSEARTAEQRALRILRHPSNSRTLLPFVR